MKTKNILVVDDNTHLLEYLKVYLINRGYGVLTATSGLDAIGVLSDYAPELVFVDFFLPHINADRLCHIVRKMEHLKDTRLLVMSAAAKELDLIPGEIGADGIIAKGTFRETAHFLIDAIEHADSYRSGGVPPGITGVNTIHPRRMTKELLDQNKHLQAIMDSISEGIIEIYKNKIVYANTSCEKILKRPLSRILTRNFQDIFDNYNTGNRIREKIEFVQKTRKSDKNCEIIAIDEKKIGIKPFPLENDNDTVIVLMTDLTTLLETEAKLKRYQEHLERLVKERTRDLEAANDRLKHAQKMEAIGAVAGGVAHDLNNILSGVVSYPDLLLLEIPEESPLRGPIKTIKKSGERAAQIVQDLLALARRGVVHDEIISVNNIVKEYFSSPEYKDLIFHHRGLFIGQVLEDNLFSIKGSSVHLAKVLMNLVTNSAEAMSHGGKIFITAKNVKFNDEVKLFETIPPGEYVMLRVEDTGEGIDSHEFKKIFEPFYTRKVLGRSGTGLGMAIVWGTVKDHNGFINIDSRKNNGTTIELYFPATAETENYVELRYSIQDYLGENESVLIIDDESDQRQIASEILGRLNYRGYSVNSGEDAVTFLRENPVDIIILDMIMEPGIDGLETYLKIREFKPDQRAIIASGFAETENIQKLLSLGVGQYVRKPYTIESIGLALKKELKRTGKPSAFK